jgi:arylsulfatase
MLLGTAWLVARPLSATSQEPADAPRRPNIVVILADDMGYSDIGPYGSEVRTPTLDALAREGVRFRQFYDNAKCSPTRASLLTGLYPHEAGMGELANGTPGPAGPYQGYLPASSVTVAEVLRGAGYRTYFSGKWHVGDLPAHWPHARGFDRAFGLISGATSFFELLKEPGRSRQMVLEDRLWEPSSPEYYATDAYTDYAVDRIREHGRERRAQPFLLYLAYTAPHFPLHAREEDIARYAKTYEAGWDAIRAARHARMRDLGVIDARHPLLARPERVPAWDDAPRRDEWARLMAVYAAMVDRMDQGIGRVMQALRDGGMDDDTLVLFLSDNGATMEAVAGRGLNDPSVPIGARGSYVAYLEPWAHVSNTPFRLYKDWVHEGGIRTPMIARWPRGIARPGRFSDHVGHVIDVMPTVVELAGAAYPRARDGVDVTPMRGRSLASALRDLSATRPEPLYWAYGGNWAIRDGDWKLVRDGKRAGPAELYDMAADPVETRDLAGTHPDRAAAMERQWRAWATRVGAREATK